jgi:hypothetical protein
MKQSGAASPALDLKQSEQKLKRNKGATEPGVFAGKNARPCRSMRRYPIRDIMLFADRLLNSHAYAHLKIWILYPLLLKILGYLLFFAGSAKDQRPVLP